MKTAVSYSCTTSRKDEIKDTKASGVEGVKPGPLICCCWG